MMYKILTLPGYGGSGAKHWQTLWEAEFDNIQRVEQTDWNAPDLTLWVESLNSYVENSNEKVILVGHSLACALVSHWAAYFKTDKVIGALLVAPADIDSEDHTPNEVRNFAPMPIKLLPFPSIVVASENDTYVSIERAEYFARSWGSDFINYGSNGHINDKSGLSSWQYGKDLIEQFSE